MNYEKLCVFNSRMTGCQLRDNKRPDLRLAFVHVARPAEFEPKTPWFVAVCSEQYIIIIYQDPVSGKWYNISSNTTLLSS